MRLKILNKLFFVPIIFTLLEHASEENIFRKYFIRENFQIQVAKYVQAQLVQNQTLNTYLLKLTFS